MSSGLPGAPCPSPLCSVCTSPSSPPAMGTEPAAPTGERRPLPQGPICHAQALGLGGQCAPGGKLSPRAVKGLAEATSEWVAETDTCCNLGSPNSGSYRCDLKYQLLRGHLAHPPHPHFRGLTHPVCSPPLWGRSHPHPASLAAISYPLGSLKPSSSWPCPWGSSGHPSAHGSPRQLQMEILPPPTPRTSQSVPV